MHKGRNKTGYYFQQSSINLCKVACTTYLHISHPSFIQNKNPGVLNGPLFHLRPRWVIFIDDDKEVRSECIRSLIGQP